VLLAQQGMFALSLASQSTSHAPWGQLLTETALNALIALRAAFVQTHALQPKRA
jgi:hypothetical protein